MRDKKNSSWKQVLWLVPLVLLVFALLVRYELPPRGEVSVSYAASKPSESRLARYIEPLKLDDSKHSGIHVLSDPHDAFAARSELIGNADVSLDLQYYIWKADLTGRLLFNQLLDAADRGVRVRLLLDDNPTKGMDPILAKLDSHERIEIRLFNPLRSRHIRALNFVFDFQGANRRMHNKSLTADGQATVVGGRNIGDEYFDASGDVLFQDVDVLAIGPVVERVAENFDLFWNAEASYPIAGFLPSQPALGSERLPLKASMEDQQRFKQVLAESHLMQQLEANSLAWGWSDVSMISDHPDKGLGKATETSLLPSKMLKAFSEPEQHFDLVSPYFVPTASGTETLVALAQRGVTVRVLTNGYESTDVTMVHAGYVKWREDLLTAGVELYEIKRSTAEKQSKESGISLNTRATSLHAKVFAIDRKRVFVGSFNFDPRSAELNTEMGFVIENERLGQEIADAFDQELPKLAYQLRYENGALQWLDSAPQLGSQNAGLGAAEASTADSLANTPTLVHLSEPGTSLLSRGFISFMSYMPIDWLL